MKWILTGGSAHLIIHADDTIVETACGTVWVDPEVGGVADVEDFQSRPFGADTHNICHSIVKAWNANPGSAPEGLLDADPIGAFVPAARSKAQRDAAVHGLAPEPNEDADGAQVPVTAVAGRRNTALAPGDDLEFPDEPGPMPVIDGAVVVVPDRKPRSRRADTADVEIDDD